jgi:hypothetical protein
LLENRRGTACRGISLERFSFPTASKTFVERHGVAGSNQHAFRFQHAMQKAALNGQPMFDPDGREPVNPRNNGSNAVTWNFSLQLQHAEEESP